MIPQYQTIVKATADGYRWKWEVRYFGKNLAEGIETTEKEAIEKAEAAAGALVVHHSLQSQDRAKPRMQLKEIMKKRSCLVAAVCEQLVSGNYNFEAIAEYAREGEEAWQDKIGDVWGRGEVGRGRPKLEAGELAKRVLQIFLDLGYLEETEEGIFKDGGLRRFTSKHFGHIWGDPGESNVAFQLKLLKKFYKLQWENKHAQSNQTAEEITPTGSRGTGGSLTGRGRGVGEGGKTIPVSPSRVSQSQRVEQKALRPSNGSGLPKRNPVDPRGIPSKPGSGMGNGADHKGSPSHGKVVRPSPVPRRVEEDEE